MLSIDDSDRSESVGSLHHVFADDIMFQTHNSERSAKDRAKLNSRILHVCDMMMPLKMELCYLSWIRHPRSESASAVDNHQSEESEDVIAGALNVAPMIM